MQRHAFFAVIVLLATPVETHAETSYRENRIAGSTRAVRWSKGGRQLRASRPTRRPSSLDITTTGKTPQAAREWSLKLGLLGGFANSNTNNPSAQASRDASSFDHNVFLGISADFRVKRYLGVEAEGFFNLAPSQRVTSSNVFTGASTSADRQLQQYGGGATLKGQLPFRTGAVAWEPRLGVGFGTVGLRQTDIDTTSRAEQDSNQQMWGASAMIGLDVEPLSRIVLSADYSRSFAASGSVVTTTTGGLSTSRSDLVSPRFERWRLGGYYRITDSFMAGGQYIGRRLSHLRSGETVRSEEILNQFLGQILVGF